MSNCFETIKKNPSVLIGLSVLTLGVLPIGYLGYRLVQWISHTELCEKVSNCFKKYCCCFPRQQDQSNIGLVGPSSGDATEGPKPLSPRRKRTVTQEPVGRSPIPEKVPFKSIPFPNLDSPIAPQGPALESALQISTVPEKEALSPPPQQPPKNFTNPPPKIPSLGSPTQIDIDQEVFRFYVLNGSDSDKGQLQYLRKSKNIFKGLRQEVQNGILTRILLNVFFSKDVEFNQGIEFQKVLDEYLSKEILGKARRQGFEAAFKLKTNFDYSPVRIKEYYADILEIFKEDF